MPCRAGLGDEEPSDIEVRYSEFAAHHVSDAKIRGVSSRTHNSATHLFSEKTMIESVPILCLKQVCNRENTAVIALSRLEEIIIFDAPKGFGNREVHFLAVKNRQPPENQDRSMPLKIWKIELGIVDFH